MHTQRTLIVVGMVGRHRPNDAKIVDDISHVREQVVYHRSALTARFEAPMWLLQIAFEVAQLALPVVDVERLAVVFDQLGFVIKRLNVRNTAGHIEKDDSLGFGFEVRLLGSQWSRGCCRFFGEQAVEGKSTGATGGSLKDFSSSR